MSVILRDFPKRVFSSKQEPRPKYRILRASVLHKYTANVYLYIFIISPQPPKTGPPHHLCTTVSRRVHKYRAECSQPIGMVVNNRQSECSHGEWRLCTNGNDTDFTALPHLYEYAESVVFRRILDSRNRKIWRCRICYFGVLSF